MHAPQTFKNSKKNSIIEPSSVVLDSQGLDSRDAAHGNRRNKMKAQFSFLMEDDEIATNPDDFFEYHGKPILTWLTEKPNEWGFNGAMDGVETRIGVMQCRMSCYDKAEKMYREQVGTKGLENLRFQPYVVENYLATNDGSGGSLETWFYFKEDNNGNTYRIKMSSGTMPNIFDGRY